MNQPTSPDPDRLSALMAEELANALGLPRQGMHLGLIASLARSAAPRLSVLLTALDADVADAGLREASRRLLAHLIEGYATAGEETIPTTGPLIIAANHPGLSDALVLLAGLPRDDVKLMISDVPITRALPHVRERLIYVSGDPDDHVAAAREMIDHLRSGGSIITFPSARLTPDPALFRGATPPGAAEDRAALACATFSSWSASILLPLRRLTACSLQVAVVSGVLMPTFARHPIARLTPAPRGWEHRRMAEFLQLLRQLRTGDRYGLVPHAAFAPPLTKDDLAGLDREAAMDLIVRRGSTLLEAQPAAGSS